MKKHRYANSKTAAVLVALLLLPSVLTACSEAPDQGSETKDGTSTPTAETVTEAPAEEETDSKEAYKPDLPDADYDGYAFRIISRDDSMHSYDVHTRDLHVEEMTGDAIKDAVYERNNYIADTYNIKIVLETHSEVVSETTPNEAVQNAVLADSDDFDMLATHMINGGNSALKSIFLNFNNLPHVDFDKPYWNKSAYNAFSVGDKTFLALSDMCFSSNDNTHCMVYNKKLADNYNIEDVYEVVRSNGWTYDRFRTLCAGITTDADGNGVMDDNDVYGYLIGGGSGLINWMFAGDLHVVAKDADNIPYLDFFSEKTVNLYDWTYELYKSDDSYFISSWIDANVVKMFSADKALFMTTQIGVIEDMRDMESDFGVLPYPKYEESQESYGHYVDGHATIMAIPKTIRDLDRMGVLMEAFAYESYKGVLPWYYDVLMTKKNVRDEESGEMLELVYNTRVFDFAYVYDNFGLSFTFSSQVTANNADLASYYKRQEKVVSKIIEKNVKTYRNAD